MRSSRLAKNTVSSLALQITTIICGFILPRLILGSFGSEINGLVTSISQFLSIITFLEMGVGAVVQSALYTPLAKQDNEWISKIIASAEKFFRRLAYILLVYMLVLTVVYPLIVDRSFGWIYTVGLIGAMGISSFTQYYFGVVDRLLLNSDQRGYIQYNAQTITLILNTAACAILIELNQSIHMVKLTTSLIYLVRPIVLRQYVKRNYSINRGIAYDGEPIRQKWNGVAQHLASVILNSGATVILTVCSTLSNVSVYSVYNLVIHGVKQLFMSLTDGFQALLGELWAKQEKEKLAKVFDATEWIIHTGTVFVFGCTGTLLLPFVRIYTDGIYDAEYIQPLFAILYTIAHAGHCLRLPYNIMILAAGHYKQTQNNYILAAVMNIVVSVASVKLFGIIGVALGAMVALFYQTIWMAWYSATNLVKKPLFLFWRQMMVDGIATSMGVILTWRFQLDHISYLAWIVLAIKVAIAWLISVGVVNAVFYHCRVREMILKIRKGNYNEL